MSSETEDIATFKQIRAVISWVLESLRNYGPPMEQLGDFVPAKKVLGIQRRAKMLHMGEVWHLGVFLLNSDGGLFEAGSSTRAVAPGHPGHVSVSQEERREQRDAAFRGGFPEGSVVNFGAKALYLDVDFLRKSTGNLFVKNGQPYVRWRPGASDDEAMPFKDYMAERLELLINPPAGATD